MSTATVGLLSSAAKVTATRTTASINASSSSTSCCCGAPFIAAVSLSSYKFTAILTTSRKLRLTCEATSDSKTSSSSSVLSPSSDDDDDDDESAVSKIGARIKVKVPLKVYHVPKVPELDLTGMVGELKQYAGLWKGKRISANLPFKVEFVIDVQGRGSLKFCAHLKRDEFDYLSD